VVNAVRVMLTTEIPPAQLTHFDITSPKQYETVIATTIRKCFTVATRLIINKKLFLWAGRRGDEGIPHDAILEDIFLGGLERMAGTLGAVMFGGPFAVRTAIHEGIRRFFNDNPRPKKTAGGAQDDQRGQHLCRVLGILVQLLPPNVTEDTKHCARFLSLIKDLMLKDAAKTAKFVQPVLEYIFKRLRAMKKPTKGTFGGHKASTLGSMLQCAQTLYDRFAPSGDKKTFEQRMQLLMRKCLFGETKRTEHDAAGGSRRRGGPHSKAAATPQLLCASGSKERELAFKLLLQMVAVQSPHCDPFKQLFEDLTEHLNVTSKEIHLGDDDDADDDDAGALGPKQHGGNRRRDFVGLVNLGCTCYLNSIVQQLFMVTPFANEILSIVSPAGGVGDGGGGGGKEQEATAGTFDPALLPELQRVFLRLRLSQRRFLNPSRFCSTVHTADGRHIDIYEQTDCQEILTALLSQLEQCLRSSAGGDRSALLDEHFGCELQYITRCCNGHISTTPSVEKALGMTVQDTPTLSASFAKFTEGEVMAADNAYYCSQCDAKVSATRRQTISKPPKQLILNLKRFEWNFETMIRRKINTRFTFEHVLDIKEYMTSNWTGDGDGDGDGKEDEAAPSEFVYDLVGIVVHQGRHRGASGHRRPGP